MEFINKVYIRKNSRTSMQVLSLIGSVICILILVISLVLDGDSRVNISILAMLSILLANSMTGKRTGKYISVVSQLDIEKNGLKLTYLAIDREDGIGKRDEIMKFNSKDINNIYYSNELNGIKIEGKGSREIKWIKANGEGKKKRIDVIPEIYIYFTDMDKEEILRRLEEATNKKIQYVE